METTSFPPATVTSAEKMTGLLLGSSSRTPPRSTRRALTIFVSGDTGSRAIIQLMIDKGVRFETRDIRHSSAGGELSDLAFLQERNLYSVPQLFDADGTLIGGYEESLLHLQALPDPKPILFTA